MFTFTRVITRVVYIVQLGRSSQDGCAGHAGIHTQDSRREASRVRGSFLRCYNPNNGNTTATGTCEESMHKSS